MKRSLRAICLTAALMVAWASSAAAGKLNASFETAQAVTSALYRNGGLVGRIQIKAGKINVQQQTVKISAAVTLIADGKTKNVFARSVRLTRADGETLTGTLAFKPPVGEMAFAMAANGQFTLANAAYEAREASIGGILPTDSATFQVMDYSRPVVEAGYEVLEEFVPRPEPNDCDDWTSCRWPLTEGEPVYVNPKTGKWTFAPAARFGLAKASPAIEDEDDEEYEDDEMYEDGEGHKDGEVYYVMPDCMDCPVWGGPYWLSVHSPKDDGNAPNYCALKLTYTPKTGLFKGSFKLYTWNRPMYGTASNVRPKLKKHTVNVIGLVVNGRGIGTASCKKPSAGPWNVKVE